MAADFWNGDVNSPVGQSMLGIKVPIETEKDRSWNHGYLAFGKVLSVNPKRYTAEVQIFGSQDTIRSNNQNEGRHAARIGVQMAGFDDRYQMPYGEITPLHKDDIVLVAFLKNSQDQPVIIKSFHDISEAEGTTNYRNILPGDADSEAITGNIDDYLKISPIQDYTKVDRQGNIEWVSHTKSFFVARNKIDEEEFDFEDLSVKFPVDKSVINPHSNTSNEFDDTSGASDTTETDGYYPSETDTIKSGMATVHVAEKWSKPKTWMAVFRDNYHDSKTNWLRVIANAEQTSLRIIKSQQKSTTNSFTSLLNSSKKSKGGACSMFEIDSVGNVRMRRQLDARNIIDYSMKRDEDNPTQNPSKQYSEIQLYSTGAITLETVDKSKTIAGNSDTTSAYTAYPRTFVYIAPGGQGVQITTTGQMSIAAQQGIAVQSDDNIMLNSKKNITMQAENNIIMQCKNSSDTNSSATFSMTHDGAAGIAVANGGSNGTQSAMSVTTKDGGAAALQTKTGETQSVISMAANGNMTQSATSTITQATSGSSMKMSESAINTSSANVKTTAGQIFNYGSYKAVGNMNCTGNASFTGCHKVNGRPAVLVGDRDSHGYRNFAMFANALVQIAESFVVQKATEMVTTSLPGLAGIAGIVNLAMDGYSNFETLGWNGIGTTMETAMTGALVTPGSPFYNQFQSFAKNLPGGANSLAVGMQFLSDPSGLNIDMETLAAEAMEMTPIAGTLHTTMGIYNSFGQPNSMEQWTEAGKGMMDKLSDTMKLTFTPQNLQSVAMNEALGTVKMNLDPAAFGEDLGAIGELGQPTDLLNNIVNVAGLKTPGESTTTKANAGGPNGGGNTQTTIRYTTIGEAVDEMATYIPTAKDDLLQIAQAYDTKNGTNTAKCFGENFAQYFNATVSETKNTGNNGGGGQGGNSGDTTTTIKPAPFQDQDHYAAAQLATSWLSSGKQALSSVNAALKNYVANKDPNENATVKEKEAQAAKVNGLAESDPENKVKNEGDNAGGDNAGENAGGDNNGNG